MFHAYCALTPPPPSRPCPTLQCANYLSSLLPTLLMDPHLGPHVNNLYALIRRNMLVQASEFLAGIRVGSFLR